MSSIEERLVRDGSITIGHVKAGSRIVRFKDMIVIVHPDDPVRYVNGVSIEDMPDAMRNEFARQDGASEA